ncbi:hypothetical protein BST81_08570 [Leptolyngbya sp. 'hensonii']|uniref:class I SAM-dependent methyltransferase n=1 Tax=Leptolyngbya sp. 'hensonii' TaxID=1922337 RepID=UPI00094F5CEF|nr:class I SAM-dependent methyltransferase [Leptolyngbya sp. 'hensonii']OLP18783.1 hypothetical protein BST81_08570 [Leptolyngbya sp. 'hensonii']
MLAPISNPPLLERTISGLHADVFRSLPPLEAQTPILDIGCGTGAWLNRLAEAGFTHLCGIDQDATQFHLPQATCIRANLDVDDPALADRQFGLITAIEVVEHLENPGRLFALVARHLAPDGYFLLTTPNIHSIGCRLRFLITGQLKSFDAKGDPTHIYPVLLSALQRVLPRYGLEIVQQWSFPQRGSRVSRPTTALAEALLSLVLPIGQPGDTLCVFIRKTDR